MCISIGHLSALCQEIVSPLSNWESDTLGNTQIRRPLWERMAFSRTNCPYPSDIPANGSANGSSPREKFLGTSENTRWKLRWVEEVGPQPESRAIANAKWLRDNFCLSSLPLCSNENCFLLSPPPAPVWTMSVEPAHIFQEDLPWFSFASWQEDHSSASWWCWVQSSSSLASPIFQASSWKQ